jgi:hypothetical protein
MVVPTIIFAVAFLSVLGIVMLMQRSIIKGLLISLSLAALITLIVYLFPLQYALRRARHYYYAVSAFLLKWRARFNVYIVLPIVLITWGYQAVRRNSPLAVALKLIRWATAYSPGVARARKRLHEEAVSEIGKPDRANVTLADPSAHTLYLEKDGCAVFVSRRGAKRYKYGDEIWQAYRTPRFYQQGSRMIISTGEDNDGLVSSRSMKLDDDWSPVVFDVYDALNSSISERRMLYPDNLGFYIFRRIKGKTKVSMTKYKHILDPAEDQVSPVLNPVRSASA